MTKRLFIAAIAGALVLPAAAQAQSRVAIPNVELFATVTGKWVLNPRLCRDIREDVRDARQTTSRRDRREDRRDQRVADCPPSAYSFLPDAGQAPKYPVRVGRGRVPRTYRGQPMFVNGDTIGSDGRPVVTQSQVYAPQPIVPQYQAPTYTQPRQTFQQPIYQQPTYVQPSYQQPTYQTAPNIIQQQPSYQAPAPSQPSNYRIENGVIIFE